MAFLGLNAASASASATGIRIANLPIVDTLNRAENPLSNGGQWSSLGWARGKAEEEKEEAGKRIGQDTTTGWVPVDASPAINGGFWNPKVLNGATAGDAAAVTMNVNPGAGRYVALWLNLHGPQYTLRNGYQLKWLENSESGSYTVTLSKWIGGEQKILASNPSVAIPIGTELALSQAGGRISAWKGSGGILSSFLSFSDSGYFATGYAGIEGSGTSSRLTNFREGNFQATPVEAAYLPVLDAFTRAESPLSNGGQWSPMSWTSGTGAAAVSGWRGPAFPSVNGAYWNPESFADIGGSNTLEYNSGGGDAVALTMAAKPGNVGRYVALWLDMPRPGTEQTGYQLKWVENADGTFELTLSKWSGGVQTVMNSAKNRSFPAGTRITMADIGDSVWAWTGSGDEYDVLISHGDTSFAGGYAGMEASGNISRSTNFQAGTLPGNPAKLGVSPLPAQPIIDTLDVYGPLSGKWSKTAGAKEIGTIGYVKPYTGWQSTGGRQTGEVSSAYWNASTFSDSGAGDAASAVLGALPHVSGYESILLNMPSPGVAKEGYELRWTGEASGADYKLEMARVGGSRAVVATKTHVALSGGMTLVLSEKAGNLVAWSLPVGADHFTPMLSASTATLGSAFTSGYVGMESGGPAWEQGNLHSFGASTLNP